MSIARTVEVTAEFSNNIIEANAEIGNRNIEAEAGMITIIRHYHSDYPDYEGEYDVVPDWDIQTLATKWTIMHDDVTVEAIPVSRTSNPSGGTTVYIGGTING